MAYLYNILKIIQYQSDLRINILQIAFNKLILLDVNSPREDILQYEESSDGILYDEEEEEENNSKPKMKHPIANALDLMMNVLFKFIKRECFSSNEKFNKQKCVELYNDLLIVFENVILPTHQCHHIQFVMFYICSFDTNVASDFLKFLWKIVTLPNISPVIRQTAVGYISSFLARAGFLSLG